MKDLNRFINIIMSIKYLKCIAKIPLICKLGRMKKYNRFKIWYRIYKWLNKIMIHYVSTLFSINYNLLIGIIITLKIIRRNFKSFSIYIWAITLKIIIFKINS
jgi:hypothetical protein